MVKENARAPEFSLPSSDGGTVALSDIAGKWAVFYFYPKDFTSGCTVEAIDFKNASSELEKRGAVVFGVSKDSIDSHCGFRDKHELNFALLSDPDGAMIEAYGAWGEKNNYGKKYMGIIRSTVIVDPTGMVRKIFPKVKVEGHVAAVLRALDSLQGNAPAEEPSAQPSNAKTGKAKRAQVAKPASAPKIAKKPAKAPKKAPKKASKKAAKKAVRRARATATKATRKAGKAIGRKLAKGPRKTSIGRRAGKGKRAR